MLEHSRIRTVAGEGNLKISGSSSYVSGSSKARRLRTRALSLQALNINSVEDSLLKYDPLILPTPKRSEQQWAINTV